MRQRSRRLVFVIACISLVGVATTLVLWALSQSVTYFYSPAEIAAMPNKPQGHIRIGGLVVEKSVIFSENQHVRFQVSDLEAELEVNFNGVLPDLFREGQGIIAEGTLSDSNIFMADQVLAKHDETYMPPEVEKTLKDKGLWKDGPNLNASDN